MLDWKIERVKETSLELKSEISGLWTRDPACNPFASPAFMEMMMVAALARGHRVFLAKGIRGNGTLAALWPVRLDSKKAMHVLPSFLCDYATAVYEPGVAQAELARGFTLLVERVKPRNILLQPVPGWGLTLGAAIQGIETAGFRYRAFPFAQVPLLRGEGGPDGAQAFKKSLCRSRSLKNYTNRIRRENGFVFEADTGTRGIDQWADQFCDAHIRRWQATSTPSKYRDAATREKLKAALHAWAGDNRLVRFSIHAMYRRITFVAGLISNRTIIHFHTARLPVYNKLGTGNITVHLMGLWMLENGYDAIDFGLGDEPYKYYFANTTRPVWRIYAAESLFSASFARGCIEAYIRRKKSRMDIWEFIKTNGKRLYGMI